MDAFRGDLTSHAPHFHPASEAAARDIDLVTARQLLPDGLSVGVHMYVRGSFFWTAADLALLKGYLLSP